MSSGLFLLEFNGSFPTFTSLRAFIQFILYYFLSIKLLSDISVYVRSIRFSSVLISETEVCLFFHSLQILSVLLISQMYLAHELGTAATRKTQEKMVCKVCGGAQKGAQVGTEPEWGLGWQEWVCMHVQKLK